MSLTARPTSLRWEGEGLAPVLMTTLAVLAIHVATAHAVVPAATVVTEVPIAGPDVSRIAMLQLSVERTPKFQA